MLIWEFLYIGVPIIAKVKDSIEQRSKVFYEMLVIKLSFAVLSAFAYFILIKTLLDRNYTIYFYLFGLYIVSVFLDITWFFQAMENFKIICIRTIIVKLMSILLIFMLVKDKSDMNLYIFINMISLMLPNLLLFVPLRKNIKLSKYKLDIKVHLKPVFEMLLPGIAYTVYAMIDKTMIKIITGSTVDVGYYEQAYKLAFVGVTVISVFATVFSSRISAMKDDDEIREIHKYSYCIICIISIPLMIGLFLLADFFIPFYYGVGYEGAINILKIFSILPFIMGISNFVSYQYFIPKIITKPSMIIVFSSILINIILNSFFIKMWGGFGAAVATIVSEGFISISYLMFYKKFQKMSIILKTVYKYFLSGLMTFGIMYGAYTYKICNSLKTFVVYACLIVVLFIIFALLMKDEILMSIIKGTIKKVRSEDNG